MYRLFRRFEWLAFSIVTASAVACAGFIIVEHSGVRMRDLAVTLVPDATGNYALVCDRADRIASCDQLLADWKEAK
jgi:hypothetical protein